MNDILGKLKGPGIGLIVTGAINAIIGLLILLSGLMRLAGVTSVKEPRLSSDAEKVGYFIGTGSSYAIALLSLILAPVIIFGAIKLMKGQSKGLAKTAAILAILPFTSCCFIVGAIFGIWALVVLANPDVKAFFAGDYNRFNPPQPPQNWQ